MVRDTGARALPQASVAVHVSVTVPPQASGVAENVDMSEVPLIRQPPDKPLVKAIVLAAGNDPHATVVLARGVIVGNVAGLMVIVLDTGVRALPQASVAVHVSVTVPPQAPGVAENVDRSEVPLIRQPPDKPLVNDIVLDAGSDPHATVVLARGVIVGNVAGLMVIVLDTGVRALPHASVAVHVSVTVPPQASGVAENVDRSEVPLIRQPPLKPLVKAIVLAAGNDPHATVVLARGVIVGNVAGLTVMVRDTGVRALPQASVAVHVSVTVPPQAPGVAENVDRSEVPLIRQPPDKPLVKAIVLAAGNDPHATVVLARAVIVGNVAGLTVIVLDTGVRALPHASVAVHVSVTVPPQAPGVAENVDRSEVPLIRQPPDKPLVNDIVLDAGSDPHATVVLARAVIVGNVAGLTVMVRDTGVRARPQASVAVHVSVTVPPQASGVAENVDRSEVPLIRQPPDKPLVKAIVLDAGSDHW